MVVLALNKTLGVKMFGKQQNTTHKQGTLESVHLTDSHCRGEERTFAFSLLTSLPIER